MKAHRVPLPPGVRFHIQHGWRWKRRAVSAAFVRFLQANDQDERLVRVLRARLLSLRPQE